MLPEDWLKQIKSAYPKRDGSQGWGALSRLLTAAMAAGADWDSILEGAKRYAIHCQRKGNVGTEFIMKAQTFFGRDQHWQEWADADLRTPVQITTDTKLAEIRVRAKALGLELFDGVSIQAAEQIVSTAEHEAQKAQWKQRGLELPRMKA